MGLKTLVNQIINPPHLSHVVQFLVKASLQYTILRGPNEDGFSPLTKGPQMADLTAPLPSGTWQFMQHSQQLFIYFSIIL